MQNVLAKGNYRHQQQLRYVTAAKDIKGMNATEIQKRLAIDASPTGYQVITFPTPTTGVSTPLYSSDPRFAGFGRTLGGAREFTVPNQPIPANSTRKIVQ